MGAKTEAVAFCGREQIGLELDRQHRGVRRHERERRIAAGAIQSSCDNAGMHEAMLLRIGRLVRHRQFDLSRRQPCDGDTQRRHCTLPGKVCADAIGEIRIFRQK